MMTQSNAIPRPNDQFPGQGILYDRAGMEVDATDWVWRLNHLSRNNKLNFRLLLPLPETIRYSVVLYIAERVKGTSTDNVRNAFEALRFLTRSTVLAEELTSASVISDRFVVELRGLSNFAVWRLNHVRAWYRWCAEQGLPHFSMETADLLDDRVIGGNEKGRAVRTRDPVHGAYDYLELGAVRTKLRAIGPKVLSIFEQALVWLMIALGRNPFAYALMRNDDYKPVPEAGTARIYHRFDIPQIKKRDVYLREGFDPVTLNHEIGAAVEALVAENAKRLIEEGWPEGSELPLFPRLRPRPDLLDGPLHEFAMHMDADGITGALVRAVKKLEIVSQRTGKPLHINTRRFRRTFGTRMVEEGASPVQLAIVLGHTDLQNVGVYFETRSSQVDRLDAALAMKLGPIADAFMGRVVDSEVDAVNGDDPAKRIPHFRRKFGKWPERNGDLGTCGSGPCALFAPVSCYTCAKFQPWKDGPHKEMLDWLVEERERKEKAGLDRQMVAIHDTTILAVAQVIAACEGTTS